MTVQTDLDTTWQEQQQSQDAVAARAALEDSTNNLEQANQAIQAIVDSGNFNTVPADLKSTLNDWWKILKTARTSIIADADIMTAFNWRP